MECSIPSPSYGKSPDAKPDTVVCTQPAAGPVLDKNWTGQLASAGTQEENMKFYFIGNDKIPTDHPLFHKAWMEDGYAYTSGYVEWTP